MSIFNFGKKNKQSFKDKIKYFEPTIHGFTSTFMEDAPRKNILSRHLESVTIDANEAVCRRYCQDLVDHKITVYNPFSKGESKLGDLIDQLNEVEFNTQASEYLVCNLARFVNILHRQIMDYPFKDEKFDLKKVQNSWKNGSVFFRRNPLKEAAWFVTHAYLMRIWIDGGKITNLIPKNPEVFEKWNGLIKDQKDVPEDVKQLFIIGENGAPFALVHPGYNPSNNKKESHPEDDVPEDGNNIEGQSFDVEAKHKELDKSFKAAIDNDSKNDSKFDVYGKAPTIDVKKAPDVNDFGDMDQFGENNSFWENRVPKLDKFTKKVNELRKGIGVYYTQNPNGFITAHIIDKNKNVEFNTFLIDPYLLFGDTIRVIYTLNGKNVYIPISKDDLVTKAIRGTITEDDAEKIATSIPKALTRSDFFGKYTMFDIVDFRGLMTPNYGPGMPFKDWKVLVENIEKILDNQFTNCARYGISHLESKDKFTLIAYEGIPCTYYSPIYNDPVAYGNVCNGKKILINYENGEWTKA